MQRLIMLNNLEIPDDLTDSDAEYVGLIIRNCKDPERLVSHRLQLKMIKDRLYKQHEEKVKNGG